MKIYLLEYNNYNRTHILSVKTSEKEIIARFNFLKQLLDDEAKLYIRELDTDVDEVYYVVQYNKAGRLRDIWCEAIDEHDSGEVCLIGDTNDYIRVAVRANGVYDATVKAAELRDSYFARNDEDK